MHHVSFSVHDSVQVPKAKGAEGHERPMAQLHVDPDCPHVVELVAKDPQGKLMVLLELTLDVLEDVVKVAQGMVKRNGGPLGCPGCPKCS